MLPICLLLFDYMTNRKLFSFDVLLEKLPFFILSIFFGVITTLSQAADGEGVLSNEEKYSIGHNLIFAGYTIIQYAYKCILPLDLSYLYPFPMQFGEAIPLWFLTYPIILVLFIILLAKYFRRHRWFKSSVIFFLIHIFIVLHLIPISRNAILADRYVYIGSISIFYSIAIISNKLLSNHKLVYFFLALYIIILSTLTYSQVKIWHDSKTLKGAIREMILNRKDFKTIKSTLR